MSNLRPLVGKMSEPYTFELWIYLKIEYLKRDIELAYIFVSVNKTHAMFYNRLLIFPVKTTQNKLI